MLRVIREVRPRWVVGENVLGLINWNAGMVFDEVQADLGAAFKDSDQTQQLESEGYEVLPFVLPAAGVGAPHRRYRVWFIAYSNNTRNSTPQSGINKNWTQKSGKRQQPQFESDRHNNARSYSNSSSWRTGRIPYQSGKKGSFSRNVILREPFGISSNTGTNSDANIGGGQKHKFRTRGQSLENSFERKWANSNPSSIGVEGSRTAKLKESCTHVRKGLSLRSNAGSYWDEWPTVSPFCDGNDGIPSRLDPTAVYQDPRRNNVKPKKTFTRWREQSIKAGGNAIVPQVFMQIAKAIEQYEAMLLKAD